ncbi:glutathione hydrolase-like YwrD proenzyme isoform X2 [Centruroides vittatus]
MAAAMAVVEPNLTGLGGDCFALFYRSSDKKVLGINGNGRSPKQATLEKAKAATDDDNLPENNGLTVTVPGAVRGWTDILENFGSGKISLKEILSPAIKLAEEGFPVTPVIGRDWYDYTPYLKQTRFGNDLLLNGRAPKIGEIIKLPLIAQTLKQIAAYGKEGFYSGYIAKKIAEEVQIAGGCMTVEDLEDHLKIPCCIVEPISTDFHGVRLWEIPPVGQGLIALLSLNILEGFDLKVMGHNSADYLHTLAETFRLAFADGRQYIADHEILKLAQSVLLDKNYASKRKSLIKANSVLSLAHPGDLFDSDSNTTYVSVIDEEGNACSFISSLYQSFGSGIVPEGCGFPLNNRGLNFSLQFDHPNVFGPAKFPYHTIIPAMLTEPESNNLLASYGVVGRFMQPQGHVQMLLNMLIFGMDPQTALDKPRLFVNTEFYQEKPYTIWLEDGIASEVKEKLQSFGHNIKYPVQGFDRIRFGRGHIITRGTWWNKSESSSDNVLWVGCDPRTDGLALGY